MSQATRQPAGPQFDQEANQARLWRCKQRDARLEMTVFEIDQHFLRFDRR